MRWAELSHTRGAVSHGSHDLNSELFPLFQQLRDALRGKRERGAVVDPSFTEGRHALAYRLG